LNFIGSINRSYDDSFAKAGAKIGDSLKIRLPNQYVVRTGRVMSVQDTIESSVTLTVATQKGVDMSFTSADLTLSMDDFSDRIIKPAMAVLAAAIESDALTMYMDVYNQVNNVGAAMTFKKLLDGRKMLVDNLAPAGDWTALLNTQDNIDLVDALKGLFQSSTQIASQYREGFMGTTGGFDFMENTLLPSHARGAADAAYTTDTRVTALPLVATPVTAITVATGTGAMADGENFTIAGVYRVHPETKVSTGVLQRFTVTTAYVGGAGAVSISPSIILAGPKQNVTITPAAGSATAAIVISGTISTNYGISLGYHKDAFTFATADLIMPEGVDFGARRVQDGISMRIVRQYDINNDALPCRVDVLYGYLATRPQLAVRWANN
jgi:hypothetical protein